MKRTIKLLSIIIALVLLFPSCEKEGLIKGQSGYGDKEITYSLNKTTFSVGQKLIITVDSENDAKCFIAFDDIVEAYITSFPYTYTKKLTEKGDHNLIIGLAPESFSEKTVGTKLEVSASTSIGIRVR